MTDRNPIACWRSNPLIAKAITIRSRGGKPGRCVVKAAELTPGGLPVVLLCRSQQRALQGKPEAPDAGSQESKKTRQVPAPRESLLSTEWLREAVCEPLNLRYVLERVKANKGAAGVDGMSVSELPDYLRHH